MRVSDDGKKRSPRWTVLVPGVGEIIGGKVNARKRLDVVAEKDERKPGLDEKDTGWYVGPPTLAGTVPHAGFGLGLERPCQYPPP